MRTREWQILVGLIVGAVGLRLFGIGHLSFAGDEETTALATLAFLDGWPPTLPGGLVYVRGLPFTALEAVSVTLFGISEASLRLVPALCAGPRIFAAWWLARPFTGPRLALLVAGLLALAPLDFEQSRNARMYSMFATLDLLAVAATVHVALGQRRAIVASLSGIFAVATHIVAITHGVVPFVAALGRGLSLRRRAVLAGIGVAGVASYLVFSRISRWAYSAGERVDVAAAGAKSGPIADHLASLSSLIGEPLGAAAVAIGVVSGAVLGGLSLRTLDSPLAKLAGAATFAAAAIASPVLAGICLVGTLIIAGISPAETHRRAPWLLASILLVTAAYGIGSLGVGGFSSNAVKETAKFLLAFPAPNWFELAASAPAFFALALVGTWVAADRGARAPVPGVWLALIVAALGPALISGVIARKAGLRFEIHAVAPLLILAVLGARSLVERLKWPSSAAALTATAVLAGCAMRPDYTFQALLRDHGPVDSPFAASMAPDHRGAADFVRRHAEDDEWIVAEDPLQQFLLIGRAELWLRSFEDARAFLRKDPEGVPREVYTGSRLVSDVPALRRVALESGRTLWLVTSGEVEAKPEWYRTPETDDVLRSWRPLAWFEGADGATRVYRLVNGEPVPPRRYGKLQ